MVKAKLSVVHFEEDVIATSCNSLMSTLSGSWSSNSYKAECDWYLSVGTTDYSTPVGQCYVDGVAKGDSTGCGVFDPGSYYHYADHSHFILCTDESHYAQ